MKEIKRIVLTGGPCAGKTTALVRIIEHFSSLGFKVFTVPEVPTLFSQGGWNYLTPNYDLYYQGELAILEMQLALEDSFMRLAETCTKPAFVVCDRGTLDIAAYMKPGMWKELTERVNFTPTELRHRYDAVLHLVSAADGAEQYYTTATNSTRYEQMNEEGLRIARDLDKNVNRAWTGHPHLRVINNHDNFEAKINRVLKEIAGVLGIPQQMQQERKYIVKQCGELPENILSEITQTYLVADPNTEVRLRRRSWADDVVNVHKTKKRLSENESVETERQVSNALYESLLQQADPYRQTVVKTRHSFIYKGQYFELDRYHGALEGLLMLETKGIEKQEAVNLPPCLTITEDVTGNPQYFAYNLALKR